MCMNVSVSVMYIVRVFCVKCAVICIDLDLKQNNKLYDIYLYI